MSAPYLSLVACSRNDDHGGRAWERMTASLECTFRQLEKHALDSEYIMVDWNPPPDRPPLRDAVPWPTGLRHVSIRVITVPAQIHRRYKLHEQWNLFSPLAYNVGLRRSRGEFAVLSMIDHLYSDALVAFLATRKLRADRAYRFPRADVGTEVLDLEEVDERLDYCRDNVLHLAKPSSRVWARGLPHLFLHACGDFQLLSREVWHRLRGYRELDLMPQHVDSFVHCAAHGLGVLQEIRSDLPIYHIDHSGGWNGRVNREVLGSIRLFRKYVPPAVTAADRRRSAFWRMLRLETEPLVEHEISKYYKRMFIALARGRKAHDFNDADWGLADEALEETTITRGDWDR